MYLLSRLPSALLAATLLLATACSRHVEFGPPPEPADLEALDPAVAEWVWRGLETVNNNPTDKAAWLRLCQIYHANGIFEEAEACYLRAIAVEPQQAKLYFLLAQTRAELGDLEGALAAIDDSIEHFPHYAPAHARRGLWSMRTGDFEGAASAFAQVNEIDPDEASGLVGQAWARFAAGDLDAARERVEELLREESDYTAALQLQAAIDESVSGTGASDEEPLVLLLHNGRMIGNDPWADEVGFFTVGIAARFDVATEYFANGDTGSAVEVLESIREDAPDNPRVLTRLGAAYLRLDRREDARLALEQALAANPDHYAAHLEMAAVCQLDGDPQQALVHVDRALTLKPDLATGHSRRGAILQGLGRYSDAVAAFTIAEEMQPLDKAIPRAMGDCHTRLGQWDGAAAGYERALILDPADPELHARVAFAYLKLGRLAEAERSLRDALDLDPPQAEAIARMLKEVEKMRKAAAG